MSYARMGLATLMVLGCGCANEVSRGPGGAGSGAAGSGGSTSSSATTSGGGGGQGGAAPVGKGSVSAFTIHSPMGNGSASSASFVVLGAPLDPSCVATDHGNCQVYSCTDPTPVPKAGYRSAGPIAITGGAYPVALTPQADNHYVGSGMGVLFSGGEKLHFDVAGMGDIPPHAATLVAPGLVTITSPNLSATVPIDPTKDLAATWSGGSAGDILGITLAFWEHDATKTTVVREVMISCELDATAGAGVIPSSLLANLSPTDALSETQLNFVTTASTKVKAGTWETTFHLDQAATTPNGDAALGTFSLQ